MSGLVKWGSYDEDAARKQRTEAKGDETFMKLTVGRNPVRVLPPKAGQNSPFKIIKQHFIKLPGNESPVVFACPRNAPAEVKDRCPACEQAAKLRATGLKIDRDKAWDLMPKLRVFANVIDRTDEDSGPKVLGFGKMIFEELTTLREDEDAGVDYTHPTKGYDTVIIREGTGKNDTSYKVKLARNASPITDDPDQMEDWYESMESLDQFAVPKTYDEVLEMLGLEGGDRSTSRRERLPVDAAPAKKRRGKKPKAPVVDTVGEGIDDDDIPY